MYDRQKSLEVVPPKEISIIGCGGIGTWVAIDIAMAGSKVINLFDDDNLEMHNLNRIPFSPNDVGKPKTDVLQEFIARMRPDIQVMQYGRVSELTQNLVKGYVVDCTDKVATQGFIQKLCKHNKLPYFRVGYDGHHLTVIDGRHEDAPKAADVWDDGSGQEGYTVVSSWVVPPQIGAALVTYIICMGSAMPPINTDVFDLANINVFMTDLANARAEVDKRESSKRKK
jgi:molybdopterin/thiamine biosynthesis adenylyltransferase